MQQKQDKKDLEEQSLRYKILPLFSTNVHIHKIPLCAIELVLESVMMVQMLKFPIDYHSPLWFGHYQAVFSLLDLSYYQRYLIDADGSSDGFESMLIVVVIAVSLYWMITLSLFVAQYQYGESLSNFRRLTLLLVSTVLLLPICNTILNLLNCSHATYYRPCFVEPSAVLLLISFGTLGVFLALITVQTFLRFEFLEDPKVFKRIRSSSYLSVGLIVYCVVNEFVQQQTNNETVQIIALDFTVLVLVGVWTLKDEHYLQWSRLLELNLILVNAMAIAMLNIVHFLKIDLGFVLLLIVWPLMALSVQKLNLNTLEFELDNVNKWNTPAMMIRYSETLRKLLKRSNDYFFEVYIHGYMEIHRQKCDNPNCPYNRESPLESIEMLQRNQGQHEGRKGSSYSALTEKSDEVLRTEKIIKKIFDDGCKIAPINPDLQLEYAHFLFDIQEKEIALKHLLLIKYEDLSFDKYYKYWVLKNRIHGEMCEKPEREFLDLVSELEVKRKEEEIVMKFEQAALINLEFWSVLNEDHPDFQKLNEIGSSRVRIGLQVRERYEEICRYAHSEKITNLYVHFLTSIENDEEMFSKIYEEVRHRFDLESKIVLQDWSNSSLSTLLVSIESGNYGTIIDLNSTCAALFGYEKYEVVNRHFKTLFYEELKGQIREFLKPTSGLGSLESDRTFFMSHKNSYLMKVRSRVQTYNSMETGMTSICTLSNVVELGSCFMVFSRSEQKLIGLSSSCIALLGIDNKVLEQRLRMKDLLTLSADDIQKIASSGANQKVQSGGGSSTHRALLGSGVGNSNQGSGNGGQVLRLSEFLRSEYLQSQSLGEGDSSSKPASLVGPSSLFSLSYHSWEMPTPEANSEDIYWIEFQIVRGSSKSNKVQADKAGVRKFEFQVHSTLTEFKYLGVVEPGQNSSYVSQFSQLNFAESIKNQPLTESYGDNITTLRLKDNIIQVIEDNCDDDLSEQQLRLNSAHADSADQQGGLYDYEPTLSRKDEENVFQSKTAFEEFVAGYRIAKSVRLILLLGILLTVCAYVGYYFVFKAHNEETVGYFSEVAYENMKIGSIAKAYALLTTLELVRSGQTNRTAAGFYITYSECLQYLEEIKLKGSAPYPVNTYVNPSSRREFYTDEFMLSYINYAWALIENLADKTTQQELLEEFNAVDEFKVQYLHLNGNATRLLLYEQLQRRQQQIMDTIQTHILTEGFMLAAAVAAVVALGAGLAWLIWDINQEKIRTLEIFLGITEQQIQKFSSKTEKFLISLHVEDTTGEVEVDDDNDHKKAASSTFAKKKRFKLVKHARSIYFKVLVIPLIAQAFFIQSFVESYTSLAFMKVSIPYIALTSKADNVLYQNLAYMQTIILNGGSNATGWSTPLLQYYREYFDTHYETFGELEEFHQTFTQLFMSDICNGSIPISEACNIPDLSPNGTLMVFTDITVRTEKSSMDFGFTPPFYVGVATISGTHKYLTVKVLDEQSGMISEFKNKILGFLIMWVFIVILITVVYGMLVLRSFLKEVNEIKDMLMLLPVSIAKQLPNVRRYVNKILKEGNRC